MRPLLLLIGDVDDWTLSSECAEMVEAMRGRGADASIVPSIRAPSTTSTWSGRRGRVLTDVENRNKPGGCCGATVGYDPAADADAHQRVEAFFGRHLGAR